jgi:hypothetical protein
VGVNLIPKGHVVQALLRHRLSGTDPDAAQVQPADQESATGTPHSVEAANVIGIDGMEASQPSGDRTDS